MSSSYYYNLAKSYESEKEDYVNFKSQVEALFPYFDSVSDNLKISSGYLDEVIICKKPFDYNSKINGRDLSNMINILLEVKKNYQTLCLECNEKIRELEKLIESAWNNYNGALAREQEQANENTENI